MTCHANTTQKTGVALLISHEVNFRAKITGDREGR